MDQQYFLRACLQPSTVTGMFRHERLLEVDHLVDGECPIAVRLVIDVVPASIHLLEKIVQRC